MVKRLFACISLIAVLFCCSACTKQTNKNVIKFASWGSQTEITVLKPLLKEFEKNNPNLKVEFIHIPQDYFRKIHMLFASNLAPDVIFINNLYLPVYAQFLEDLTPQVKNRDDFFEKSLDSMSVDGKLYAVPRDISTLVIYYNKDLFDKYNVEYPTPEWTFADFMAIAQKLTHKKVWGISFEENSLFYLPYLMSEGGGILSDDTKSLILDSPQSRQGLQFYADLKNKYNVAPKKYESASKTMAQLFIDGQLAMHLSGRWLVPKYREAVQFDWDVISFPHGSAGSVVPIDASGWAITKSSQKKQEALKLIEFLSSNESIAKMTSTGLITPALKSVAYSDVFLDGKPQNSKVFIDITETSKKTPVSKDYRETTDKADKQLEILFRD